MSVVLSVEDVVKYFGRPRRGRAAVDGVSFDLAAGRTLALVGESGAGKSTTARLAIRLMEPDRGSIRLLGQDISTVSGRELRRTRRDMQMVFQNPAASFHPSKRIGVSVAEPLRVHLNLNRAERETQAEAALERVGLDRQLCHRYPRELSGGQLQRASIARALIVQPRVVVCDESIAALDVSVQAGVLNLLVDLQEETGVSYLFVTHDLTVARAFADDALVMRDGQVVAAGSTREVFDRPTNPYVAELVAATPVLQVPSRPSYATALTDERSR